ncbi:MAG TPA: type IV toxin-antitoxin system AbiEi family antitoxin domain-containing protein [Pyrinomonadaceae bacterium]|nr:type IV toxin-antitoxin system AbiEi family antitoxin domain-containing protein [Pyrinomonadaceae bacterium]
MQVLSIMENIAAKKAIKILQSHGGALRTSDILGLGIHPRTLYELRDTGRITQITRGVYQLSDEPTAENIELIAAAMRVPDGVICLISALSFHRITNEVPHEVYLAIPKGRQKPRLDFPPLRVFRFEPEAYSSGVEQHAIEGTSIKVYSMEKTVADCFKFRNRIGLDVALEALRLCIRNKGSRKKILEFARVCRVERVIRPYLEAIQ